MKSPVWRGNRVRTSEPISVVNDTKFISKIAKRKIPMSYMRRDELGDDKYGNFLGLYGIICIYIFLIIAVIIGGGGIAVCIVYYNSDENTQQWKIGGIILGAVTCIAAIILMIVTIFKQTRNRPWRYKVQDILLHPDDYFTNNSDQSGADNLDGDESEESTDDDDDDSDYNNKTVDTTLSSIPNGSANLLKTVHNDLVYCLGCNRLHSTDERCKTPISATKRLPPLKRIKSIHSKPNAFGIHINNKASKKPKASTVVDHSVKFSLSNETQIDPTGNSNDTLVLQRVSNASNKSVGQSPGTKIMIVRVPQVAGELVIQPKEH